MTDSRTDRKPSRAAIAQGLGAAVGSFLVGTLALSVIVTLTADRTLAEAGVVPGDLGMFEMTSGAAYGIASAVMALVMGLIGMITAGIAALFGLAIGAVGIAGAVVVGLGVVTGPILLVAGITILIKRRFFPDVI